MSFVRTAVEVRKLKAYFQTRSNRTEVLAKIEKREALDHLDEIIDASDGVLVARGDLAVEVGSERVPVIQKRVVRTCNVRGKTVIIATQMLMSMVENPPNPPNPPPNPAPPMLIAICDPGSTVARADCSHKVIAANTCRA